MGAKLEDFCIAFEQISRGDFISMAWLPIQPTKLTPPLGYKGFLTACSLPGAQGDSREALIDPLCSTGAWSNTPSPAVILVWLMRGKDGRQSQRKQEELSMSVDLEVDRYFGGSREVNRSLPKS